MKEAKQATAAELAEQWRAQAKTHRGVARRYRIAAASGVMDGSHTRLAKHHEKQAEAAERTAKRFEKEAEKQPVPRKTPLDAEERPE